MERIIFYLLLLTSYFLPFQIHAQQTNHPTPDSLCQCGGPALTTVPTNAGTNFLLCFEENIDQYYRSIYSSGGYLGIYCASLGTQDTVTITCNHYPSYSKVFILTPNGSFTYTVTGDSLLSWIVSSEVVDDRVVQVHSTSPIVCYGMNYKRWSADAFCALPLEYSGTDYRVMSYASSSGAVDGGAASGEFAVAAFEDNTVVTITPTVQTIGGNAAGVPERFTLNKGECVQVQADTVGHHNADAYLDLTGSTIISNKQVAVYGGHVETEIPDFFVRPSDDYVTRDMLLEALPPTSAWGYSFVLEPITLDSAGHTNPAGDLMRVLALDSNTEVFVNGEPWVTLNSPSNTSAFADSLITIPTLVTSSNPLMVAEYAHSSYTYYGPGDPFLAIVPPMEQTYNNFTFFLPPDTNFSYQGLIVAADTNAQDNIRFDGTLIPSSEFKPVPGSVNGRSFSIGAISKYFGYKGLPQGIHTISTTSPPEQGFTILGYGVGFANAYGYAAGQLLVPKRSIRIDYPPVVNGPVHPNTLTFHNTAYQPAYLDTALFIPDDFKNAAFGIHIAENVAIDLGRVDIGGSGQIHLVSDIPLNYPVSGVVKIVSHLPSYPNIEPAEMRYTLYPDVSAGVSNPNELSLNVTATPNPFSSYTTINFSLTELCDITITLYDELGRIVRHVASSEFSTGSYSVGIGRFGMANGVYTCVIASRRLNIHARIPIVAGE
jgi:hypothetical protein